MINLLKNMKLKNKFILPILIIGIITGIVFYFLTQFLLNRMSSEEIRIYTRNKAGEIYDRIESQGEEHLKTASMFTKSPQILNAYKVAHQGDITDENSNDSRIARQMIREYMKPYIEGYEEEFESKPQIHFHLPPARSLVRIWRDKQVQRNGEWVDISDDISKFRETVREINSGNQSSVIAIEIGKGGFTIRGIDVIKDESGNILGSVEVLSPIDDLFFSIAEEEWENISLYMNTDLLQIATIFQGNDTINDEYVFIGSTDKEISDKLVDISMFNDNELKFTDKGRYDVLSFPLNDYKGEIVGYGTYILDKNEYLNASGVALLINQMIISLISGVVFIILILVLLSIILSGIIARPIIKISDTAKRIAEGQLVSERLKHKSKDEVGELTLSINSMLDFLSERNEILHNIAKGDLTSKVKIISENDEQGRTLSEMLSSLNELVSQIHMSAEQITSGADQMSSSSEDLSKGATNQAASLEEISASISQISGQVIHNTENSIESSKGADKAREVAERGNIQMKELVKSMQEINKSANDINSVVDVIDDIAFQTNILALNADIESARVGKYGRGFAVVANSVRNLAIKSQESVKKTKELVERAIANIETGNDLVEMTSRQLDNIVDTSDEVNIRIKQVAEASKEQSEGIEQISGALSEVEEVVQSNSANSEQNASTAEQLAGQAKILLQLVSNFNIHNGKKQIETKETSSEKGLTTYKG
jgi:methyl-accepting chemotaxis protein